MIRAWHLLALGAVALCALTGLVTIALTGHAAAHETTQTIAIVPGVLPQQQAQEAAITNTRSAVPAIEAFYFDHGSYSGATAATLRVIDSTIDPTVRVARADGRGYCLESTVDGQTASFTGPGEEVTGPGGC